jgi:hypothetical protein
MITPMESDADAWKRLNAGRLIDCRWGCRITAEACRTYQSRAARYVIHFNGHGDPRRTVNAEFLMCFIPEACPHRVSDEEAAEAFQAHRVTELGPLLERRGRFHRQKALHRLVSPDVMLNEDSWHRSLIEA